MQPDPSDPSRTGLPASPLPDLARFRFGLRALDPLRLPEYPGSAWRGLLGQGLRRTACVTRQHSCAGCLLIHGCVYSQLFETPPPPGLELRGFTAMPHPYALDIDPSAPREYAPGEALQLGISLIGPAIAHVPYLIHALGLAGERGIGPEHGRFALERVDREQVPGGDLWERVYAVGTGEYHPVKSPPPPVPTAPERVSLRLITPLRIKHDGHFVGPRNFRLADLLRHLYNRLQRLALLYGGVPEAFDWRRDGVAADDLTLAEARLGWHDWTRYSSRQRTEMQMGGLLGELVISGPGLAVVWPALWLGQWTHVGKGTAFGLGSYRLQPVANG
jgi:hypothetical protein